MDDLEQTIRNIFADHVVTCLVDNDEIEAWRFMKPDTRDCQIDIMMTKYGMAMVGDYGEFTFYVGRSYGMNFLANPNKWYVAQKIHTECKRYELDKKSLYEYCLEEIKDHLSENLEDADEQIGVINEKKDLTELCIYLGHIVDEFSNASNYRLVYEMIDFIGDVEQLEDIDDACRFLYEQDWLQDTFEWNIKVLDSYTQGRIWAMHVMAEKVLEYKNGNKE